MPQSLNQVSSKKKLANIHVGDIHEVDQFICSECGIHLEDWVRVKYDEDFYPQEKYFLEYSFKYCPNCGRKIVGY